MRKVIALVAVFLLLPGGFLAGATAKKKSSAKKSTTRKAPARKTASSGKKSTTVTKKSAARKPSRRTAGRSRGQSWRTRQLQPTPDRYKQIQQALVQKGYLSGEPTGTWNQDSIAALRRFQQDQKLEPTGKIDSLSLIALGLGPKRETAAAVAPPRPQSPPATPNP